MILRCVSGDRQDPPDVMCVVGGSVAPLTTNMGIVAGGVTDIHVLSVGM